LGALIGGIFGGILGGTSSNWILGKISKKKIKNQIEKLEKLQSEQGNWVLNEEISKVIGVKHSYCLTSLPPMFVIYGDKKHYYWITINIYALICFYYGLMDKKMRKKKIQELQKLQNKNQSSQKMPKTS
jgi:hypothetical protein